MSADLGEQGVTMAGVRATSGAGGRIPRRPAVAVALGLVLSLVLALVSGCGSGSSDKSSAEKPGQSAQSATPSAPAGRARVTGQPTECLSGADVSRSLGVPMTLVQTQPASGVLKCSFLGPGKQKRALLMQLSTYVKEDAPRAYANIVGNFTGQLKTAGEAGGIGTESRVFSTQPFNTLVVAYDENGTAAVVTLTAPDARKLRSGMLATVTRVLAKY